MIFKIRVILETEDNVFRDIEIKDMQTLWNLHEGIKSAFSLEGDELASFYKSDNNWTQGKEISLEDMSENGDAETMSDVYIKEAFTKVGDKMLFVYDFMKMWSFYVELLEIIDKKAIGNYPLTVYRFGKMPLKAPDKKFNAPPNLDDFGFVDVDMNIKFEDDINSFNDDEEEDSFDDQEELLDDDSLDDDTEI
ncbi:MAG: plasmid pRiA4b ORF-3 family protein [Flavobacteriaceae bacterium]|jgi:hypothetical protein|nr:plasmid pRiA4b ORF-3 family protein [Flavobacteriaceae bacterium]